MAIKMRINKDTSATCESCGNGKTKSLEMFDVCIGENIMTICDACNEVLFNKTLKATVGVNHKLKSQQDLKVIRSRHKQW